MNARFRSIIEFTVKPGAERAFLDAFKAAGMLTRPREVPGFVNAELAQDGSVFTVIGYWETAEAYAHWQGIAQQEAPIDALRALTAAIEKSRPGRLFELVSLQ